MKEHVEYLNMSYSVGFQCAHITGHFVRTCRIFHPV